jgi:phosphatidylinositol alpha-1,6-mannosyltransferase
VAQRPLRIAFFAQDFPPDFGGTHSYNVEFARRLHERGHDVRVFAWESGDAGERDAAASDAEMPFAVHRQPFYRPRRSIEARGVTAALVRWQSEVAFVSGGSGAVSAIVHTASREVPTCVSVHDLRDKGRGRGRLGRWRVRRRYGFDRAARITANSRHTRDRLLRLGVPGERVALVHPGVDLSHFAPDPESGRRLREELGLGHAKLILTVSRLAPNKGHLRIIDLLPRLHQSCPNAVYLIVGEGGMRDAIAQRAAELGVGEQVRVVGRVEDTRPYYNACDVFAMASSRHGDGSKAGEGFGIAYVEAGACGRPSIASSSGGGGEVVSDGETGRVVDPDDSEALATALGEILTDAESAAAMGARARERAARFDWNIGAEQLERVLLEAVSEGGERSG